METIPDKRVFFHHFPRCTKQGYHSTFMEMNTHEMKRLNLTSVPYDPIDACEYLIPRLKRLTSLCLAKCTDFLTNTVLEAVFEHLITLEKIEFTDAPKITSVGFTGTYRINRLINLRQLTLKNVPKLDDECLATFNLPRLAILQLMNCPKVTLDGMKPAILNCVRLETIYVDKETPVSLVGLNEFARKNMKYFRNSPLTEDERQRGFDSARAIGRQLCQQLLDMLNCTMDEFLSGNVDLSPILRND